MPRMLPILGEQKCASIFSCSPWKVVISQSSLDDGDTLLHLEEIANGKSRKEKVVVNMWHF
jgi:hypothetical protein